MSRSDSLNAVQEYIRNTRFATLNYVREDNAPVSRAMGSFTIDGTNIVFSSQPDAAKVAAIKANRRISFFFEHDNQGLSTWKNVLAIGNAELVEDKKEKSQIADILASKNPRIKERIDKGELDKIAVFVLKTEEFQYLDRTKGPAGTEKIAVGNSIIN